MRRRRRPGSLRAAAKPRRHHLPTAPRKRVSIPKRHHAIPLPHHTIPRTTEDLLLSVREELRQMRRDQFAGRTLAEEVAQFRGAFGAAWAEAAGGG